MPRVAHNPRLSQGRRDSSQHTTPLKVPLNDDAEERVARLQSRQAMQEIQMNRIQAAVKTPMPPRARKSIGLEGSGPTTPTRNVGRRSLGGPRQSMTPNRRVPILANFEEWMKMATDNKINATNSWNFALIDYFYDMSLLREGDTVNFQKASCTLDGCVKIYTSRVDSVATETGKLLSGLADSNSNNNSRRDTDPDDDTETNEDADQEGAEEEEKRKPRRKRVHEATLAPSFAALKLKKFELEFSVDPLFKKASADFDEGGAKGLLLNNLSMDGNGRIIFDSSDDLKDSTADEPITENNEDRNKIPEEQGVEDQDATPVPETSRHEETVDIDLQPLANMFFPNLDLLSEQTVCPSLKDFELGDQNASINIPFLNAHENNRHDERTETGMGDPSGIDLDDDMAVGFDDGDGTIAGFDLDDNAGFGEGGEAWAREAALEPMMQVHGTDETVDNGNMAADESAYRVSLSHLSAAQEHETVLSYFDNALKKDWAGPEHWKIRRIKDASIVSAAPRLKKEKESFAIDFSSPLNPAIAETIYTTAQSNTAISLPKTQWRTKGRNLLPDDKHFNSKQLLRLFLKPKARMGLKSPGRNQYRNSTAGHDATAAIDERYWASQDPHNGDTGPQNGYDANFFADDDQLPFADGLPFYDNDDDNMPFGDNPEAMPGATGADGSNGLDEPFNSQTATAGGFGSQLVTQGNRRLRPDFIAYARVAKKVDVRRLKDVMWKGMDDHLPTNETAASTQPTTSPEPDTNAVTRPPTEAAEDSDETVPNQENQLRFTSVMNGLKSSYSVQALDNLSTSYCFICLLHLANEKGLSLSNQGNAEGPRTEDLEEIFVAKDPKAVLEENI